MPRSVWQTPEARIRTRTSFGPGSSIVNSSTSAGAPGVRAITPRAVIAINDLLEESVSTYPTESAPVIGSYILTHRGRSVKLWYKDLGIAYWARRDSDQERRGEGSTKYERRRTK